MQLPNIFFVGDFNQWLNSLAITKGMNWAAQKIIGAASTVWNGFTKSGSTEDQMKQIFSKFDNYFHAVSWISGPIREIKNEIFHGLYHITNGLEDVYHGVFGIVGMAGDSAFNAINKVMLGFSTIILLFFLIKAAYQFIYGDENISPKTIVKNLVAYFGIIVFIPLTLNLMTSMFASAGTDYSTNNGVDSNFDTSYLFAKSDGNDNLAFQPVKHNVTDLTFLANKNFKYLPEHYKNGANTITAASSTNSKGKANGNSFDNTDFTDIVENDDMNKNNNIPKDLFKYKLVNKSASQSGKSKKLSTNVGTNKLSQGVWGKITQPHYERYATHTFFMIAEWLMIDAVFIFMAVKIVTDVWELVTMQAVAPVVGAMNFGGSGKVKTFIQATINLYVGLVFNAMLVKLYTIALGVVNTWLPGNVSNVRLGLYTVIAQLGLFLGILKGSSIVDRLLGTRSGASQTALPVAALAALGGWGAFKGAQTAGMAARAGLAGGVGASKALAQKARGTAKSHQAMKRNAANKNKPQAGSGARTQAKLQAQKGKPKDNNANLEEKIGSENQRGNFGKLTPEKQATLQKKQQQQQKEQTARRKQEQKQQSSNNNNLDKDKKQDNKQQGSQDEQEARAQAERNHDSQSEVDDQNLESPENQTTTTDNEGLETPNAETQTNSDQDIDPEVAGAASGAAMSSSLEDSAGQPNHGETFGKSEEPNINSKTNNGSQPTTATGPTVNNNDSLSRESSNNGTVPIREQSSGGEGANVGPAPRPETSQTQSNLNIDSSNRGSDYGQEQPLSRERQYARGDHFEHGQSESDPGSHYAANKQYDPTDYYDRRTRTGRQRPEETPNARHSASKNDLDGESIYRKVLRETKAELRKQQLGGKEGSQQGAQTRATAGQLGSQVGYSTLSKQEPEHGKEDM